MNAELPPFKNVEQLWKGVYHRPCHNPFNEEGEVDLLQPWGDDDPNPLVGPSILLPRWSEPTLAIWRGLLTAHTWKTPHQQWGSNLQSLECIFKLLPTEVSWALTIWAFFQMSKDSSDYCVISSVEQRNLPLTHAFTYRRAASAKTPSNIQERVRKQGRNGDRSISSCHPRSAEIISARVPMLPMRHSARPHRNIMIKHSAHMLLLQKSDEDLLS